MLRNPETGDYALYQLRTNIKTKAKEGSTRQDIYNEILGKGYLIPFNLADYKVYEAEDGGFEIVADFIAFANSPEEAHLVVESKMDTFLSTGEFLTGFTVSAFFIESVSRMKHYTEYKHTKDNIDVNWFVETDKYFLFEVQLEEEVTSVEDYEVDTIRFDIDKETLSFGLYVTNSEDYDISEEIDADSQSIDVQEIIPHLLHFRYNYPNQEEDYNRSYEERGLKGELV